MHESDDEEGRDCSQQSRLTDLSLVSRELSANVQFNAASAQKVFWQVVEEKRREASFKILLRLSVHRLNRRLETLADSQRYLIESLRKIPSDKMSAADFTKVADDLYRNRGDDRVPNR